MSIEAITMDGHVLTASSLGALGNAALSDGVLVGCDMSYSNGNVSITEGYIVLGGRVLKISSGTTVSMSGGTTYVLASITVGSNPGASLSCSDTAPTGTPTEVNLSAGGTRTAVIGNISYSGGSYTITKVPASGGGSSGSSGSWTPLWFSDPTWSGDSWTAGNSVTPSDIADFCDLYGISASVTDFYAYAIMFRINPGNSYSDIAELLTSSTVIRPTVSGIDNLSYSVMAATNRSNLHPSYYTRRVIVSSDGTFTFGYASHIQPTIDSSWSNDQILVPVAIYGIA